MHIQEVDKYMNFVQNLDVNSITEQQFMDLGKVMKLVATDEMSAAQSSNDENRYNTALNVNSSLDRLNKNDINPNTVNGMLRTCYTMLEKKKSSLTFKTSNSGGMFNNNNSNGFSNQQTNTIFGNTQTNNNHHHTPDITINSSMVKKTPVVETYKQIIPKKVLTNEEILETYVAASGHEFKPLYHDIYVLRLEVENGEYKWVKGAEDE